MAAAPAPSLQLAEYLEKLPGTTFRKLYLQPSTAFAIFRRMLPHLGMSAVVKLCALRVARPRMVLLTVWK